MADTNEEQAATREEVMKCEQEIQSIKAALRRLGTASGNDEPNSLEIVLLKVCATSNNFLDVSIHTIVRM